MSERHELFEELDAFDPYWQKNYRTLAQAVVAASAITPYIRDLYTDYANSSVRSVDGVPDILGYIEDCKKAEEESPFFQRAMKRMGVRDA